MFLSRQWHAVKLTWATAYVFKMEIFFFWVQIEEKFRDGFFSKLVLVVFGLVGGLGGS